LYTINHAEFIIKSTNTLTGSIYAVLFYNEVNIVQYI